MAKKNNGRLIEDRPIGDLVPYARNARTHSDHQVAEILASMIEFGFTNPVPAARPGLMVAGRPYTETPAANDERLLGMTA